MAKKGQLTPKQALFVLEYLVDLNATQASIRAGYSAKTAQRIGSENLSKPLISAKIQKERQKREEKIEINAAWVLKEQARVYHRCMEDEPVRDKDGNETGQYKFEHSGANKALENIGKHVDVQAFKERMEIDASTEMMKFFDQLHQTKGPPSERDK